MSGVKLSRLVETWLEVQAECRECGIPLRSDAVRAVNTMPLVSGERLVVKVQPCWNCAELKKREIKGASIHREGVRS